MKPSILSSLLVFFALVALVVAGVSAFLFVRSSAPDEKTCRLHQLAARDLNSLDGIVLTAADTVGPYEEREDRFGFVRRYGKQALLTASQADDLQSIFEDEGILRVDRNSIVSVVGGGVLVQSAQGKPAFAFYIESHADCARVHIKSGKEGGRDSFLVSIHAYHKIRSLMDG